MYAEIDDPSFALQQQPQQDQQPQHQSQQLPQQQQQQQSQSQILLPQHHLQQQPQSISPTTTSNPPSPNRNPYHQQPLQIHHHQQHQNHQGLDVTNHNQLLPLSPQGVPLQEPHTYVPAQQQLHIQPPHTYVPAQQQLHMPLHLPGKPPPQVAAHEYRPQQSPLQQHQLLQHHQQQILPLPIPPIGVAPPLLQVFGDDYPFPPGVPVNFSEKPATTEQKAWIVRQMDSSNETSYSLARKLGCSSSYIRKIMFRSRHVAEKKPVGRPKTLDAESLAILQNASTNRPDISMIEAMDLLQEEHKNTLARKKKKAADCSGVIDASSSLLHAAEQGLVGAVAEQGLVGFDAGPMPLLQPHHQHQQQLLQHQPQLQPPPHQLMQQPQQQAQQQQVQQQQQQLQQQQIMHSPLAAAMALPGSGGGSGGGGGGGGGSSASVPIQLPVPAQVPMLPMANSALSERGSLDSIAMGLLAFNGGNSSGGNGSGGNGNGGNGNGGNGSGGNGSGGNGSGGNGSAGDGNVGAGGVPSFELLKYGPGSSGGGVNYSAAVATAAAAAAVNDANKPKKMSTWTRKRYFAQLFPNLKASSLPPDSSNY